MNIFDIKQLLYEAQVDWQFADAFYRIWKIDGETIGPGQASITVVLEVENITILTDYFKQKYLDFAKHISERYSEKLKSEGALGIQYSIQIVDKKYQTLV